MPTSLAADFPLQRYRATQQGKVHTLPHAYLYGNGGCLYTMNCAPKVFNKHTWTPLRKVSFIAWVTVYKVYKVYKVHKVHKVKTNFTSF